MWIKHSDTRGFTLVELVIVIAVIAIVGAIVLPNFLTTTDKARLKSDIQSARILRNAADLYDAEQRTSLPRASVSSDISTLIAAGYLASGADAIQTVGAVWEYSADKSIIVVNLSACSAETKQLGKSLDAQEKALLSGLGE